jgi:hypothetical protein
MKGGLNLKRAGMILLFVFLIVLFFTAGDYLTHLTEEEYSVPMRYYTNKMIYGTLFGFVAYLLIWKRSFWFRVVGFSVVVSVLLQVRYYLEGYSTHFVLLFLGIHFVLLLIFSYIGFKVLDKYLK